MSPLEESESKSNSDSDKENSEKRIRYIDEYIPEPINKSEYLKLLAYCTLGMLLLVVVIFIVFNLADLS